MAYNIEEMKNLISSAGGISKANQYRIELSAENNAKRLDTMCRAVNMPGRQILTTERRIGITTKLIPYGYAKENVSMTFTVLNDSYVRYYFESWMNTIVNNSSYEVGYYNDFTRQITVKQMAPNQSVQELKKKITPRGKNTPQSGDISFGRSDQLTSIPERVIYTCILEEAYPVSITGINYSDNTQDMPVELTVEFSYKNWRTNTSVSQTERLQQSDAFKREKLKISTQAEAELDRGI